MHTIIIASGKGGTLKTTLTAALGVYATTESRKVALIDLNADQASLTRWWVARGEPRNPFLLKELERLHRDLQALAKAGWQWCFVDTPPDDMTVIEVAIVDASMVLIPVRASALDIEAAEAVVDMCRRRRKPFAFLLTAVDARPAFRDGNAKARATLVKLAKPGGTVLTAAYPYNQASIVAMATGKTGHEVDAALLRDMKAIWGEIKQLGEKA